MLLIHKNYSLDAMFKLENNWGNLGGSMKLMTAESLIKILSSIGCRVFIRDGLVCTQGGNLHNLDNDHPLWKLIFIHYSLICKHFGVSE